MWALARYQYNQRILDDMVRKTKLSGKSSRLRIAEYIEHGPKIDVQPVFSGAVINNFTKQKRKYSKRRTRILKQYGVNASLPLESAKGKLLSNMDAEILVRATLSNHSYQGVLDEIVTQYVEVKCVDLFDLHEIMVGVARNSTTIHSEVRRQKLIYLADHIARISNLKDALQVANMEIRKCT